MQALGLPLISLFIAMFSIQTGVSVAKHLFPLIGAVATTSLRCALGSLILLAVFRPWKTKIPRRAIRPIILYGLALAGMNLLFYLSIARIPLGLAVALEFSGPLALAFVHSRKPVDFLWATLAVAGIVLLLPLGKLSDQASALDPLGAVLALAAGGCWALYILAGQGAGRELHGGVASTLGMTVAGILLLPLGAVAATPAVFQSKTALMALAVAVFSSALPYPLEMISLKRLPTLTFGILMSMEPAIASLSGYFLLGERLTTAQSLAVGCVILASAGTTLTSRKPRH